MGYWLNLRIWRSFDSGQAGIFWPHVLSKLVTSVNPKGSYDENAPLVAFGQAKDINSPGAITPPKSFER